MQQERNQQNTQGSQRKEHLILGAEIKEGLTEEILDLGMGYRGKGKDMPAWKQKHPSGEGKYFVWGVVPCEVNP